MFEQISGLEYLGQRSVEAHELLVGEQKQLEPHDELLNTF